MMSCEASARVKAQILEREPDLGHSDKSRCLPAWIESFAVAWEKGGEMTLSHTAVGQLLHTLYAAERRAEYLVSQRDGK